MRRFVALGISLSLLLGIMSKAHATISLAWAKVIDLTGPASFAQCTDSSGNTLCGLSSGTTLTVAKIDTYGAQVWSSTSTSDTIFTVYRIAADSLGNTYLLGSSQDSAGTMTTTMIMKYGPDGKYQWTSSVATDTNDSSHSPIAMMADSLGVRAAFRVGDIFTLADLLYAVSLDANGIQTGSISDSTSPLSAKYCVNDSLVVAGAEVTNSSTGVCKVFASNGSNVLNYSISGSCIADADGANDVYVVGNLGGSYHLYTLTKYDGQGTQLWSTNATYGSVDSIAVANANQVFLYNHSTGLLALIDPDIAPFPQSGSPTPVFSESLTFDSMAADSGGGIVTLSGNIFRRYDLQGVLTWAQAFAVANMATPVIQGYIVPSQAGGQLGPDPLYFNGYGQKSGQTHDSIFLGKYVANTAVLGLTLSPTYVTGGSPVTGTVALNAPAAVGGASIHLATSAPTVAKPPLSISIPQGSSTGTFAASTFPVNVKTAVTLAAYFGGAKRAAVVNVMPATIASVSTNLATVKGGTYVTGTVTLTGKAGSAGRSVALTSSNPAVAPVPPGETVAPGASSVNFVFATHPVSAKTAVTITARSGSTIKTTTLTVTP